ncbi:MAG: LysM peptidoglycan-binding domain-containing protein [Acidaminococcales bacterium]|jgi:hypothetical protein|nr:LysM peptidoglycan-binding domain-containing protein [Acidaminococcales bacterium]
MNITKALLALFAASVACSFAFLPFAAPDEVFERVEIIVLPGDTVWAISAGFAAGGEDIRAVVERVYKENRLGAGDAIRPGQKITVPVLKGQAGGKVAFAGRRAAAP